MPGERAQLLRRIAVIEVHRLRTELLRELRAIVDAVDGEDARRPEELRRLHREEPDRPGAEHCHGIAGPDAAVLRAAVRGRQDVAEEERVVVGERGVDLLGDILSTAY